MQNSTHLQLLWMHLKEHKKTLILALLLATINQVFSLLDPLIFRIIIDDYATQYASLSQSVFFRGVALLLIGAVVVAFISRLAKNFQDYYVNVISQRVGARMYANSVEHSLSIPYVVFEDQRSGEILQKLQKAKLDMQLLIAGLVNVVFFSIIGILFVLLYAFITHWAIGVAFVMCIPIIAIGTYIISRKIRDVQKSVLAQSTELAGLTTETLRNVELVKSLGLEGQEIKRLNDVNDKILALELKKIKLVRRLSFIQGTMINLLRTGIMLLMLYLIFNGQLTLGAFFTLLLYSFFVFNPLSEFGNIASQYQEAKASYEQLQGIMSIKKEEKPKDPENIPNISSITFKDVSFKYQSSSIHSIDKVNFMLRKGETVAFVGPSGAGKSTIIKLLVGLYSPTSGQIIINDSDSRNIDYERIRKRIGLVSQETQLFAGTIRENLLFVNPAATDKECYEVLRLAAATNILERGRNGLDTKIGEGGIKISGGERQRLAIARALLRNPEMIIFDEATSSLDSVTEKDITRTIEDITRIKKDVMVVMVAHRLSTIAHADTIYVLEKGKIVEHGTHEQLVSVNGLYEAFWRQQTAERRTL